ncbi:hypothetical protein SAMN05428987_4836 [Paenibacillus sp. CF095]|uniref:hypothetical protein n=1 Tax=Paenibacillus sp. CF095 TaxID=1881033 RepID=UPI0008800649|nr:hypothetical protein [Paenibacillus sp. CF095]SDD40706.1 hypothetical protein SAMN05428987_4836 [Paenibacillus sp. CF095]
MVFEITGEGSGEDGIDSEEAKRSPLSPGFPFKKGIKQPGDNSDQKNDPDSERSATEYRIN